MQNMVCRCAAILSLSLYIPKWQQNMSLYIVYCLKWVARCETNEWVSEWMIDSIQVELAEVSALNHRQLNEKYTMQWIQFVQINK